MRRPPFRISMAISSASPKRSSRSPAPVSAGQGIGLALGVDTPMHAHHRDFLMEYEKYIPLGRMTVAEDLVGTAIFLASEASASRSHRIGFVSGNRAANNRRAARTRCACRRGDPLQGGPQCADRREPDRRRNGRGSWASVPRRARDGSEARREHGRGLQKSPAEGKSRRGPREHQWYLAYDRSFSATRNRGNDQRQGDASRHRRNRHGRRRRRGPLRSCRSVKSCARQASTSQAPFHRRSSKSRYFQPPSWRAQRRLKVPNA